MDLRDATWTKEKYLQYFDEVDIFKSINRKEGKEAITENKMQELSRICTDISMDFSSVDEISMVTLCLPYDHLRYLHVKTELKEDNNMPIHFCCEKLPDEVLKILGMFPNDDTAKPQTKPKWINGLPAVKKVEVYNDRVVKVTFIDDTFTKSICSENDVFDLDVGITICALKRLLGTNSYNATKHYNQFIKHAHKIMEENALEEVAEKARKASEKAKRRKTELKKAAEKLKAKEAQIDIQKQAYLRAMMEMTEDDLK